ncbi:MAG: thiamine phosphate synthase [Bacteroidales bacterium]|nr:thiamine phosphate synthase [Bacteroidales bacterium]
MNLEHFRLQFITHYTEKYSYIDSARIALEGGCRWIQLRMKDADESLLEETALIVQNMCKEYGATFIIDDNVHLCKKIKADGVHLGKNDMPVDEARNILGSDFIIGATVNTFEDILLLCQRTTDFVPVPNSHTRTRSQHPHPFPNLVPNYFGCGPFRFTSTKKNLAPILGIEGYKNIINKMKENNINIPLVAIGGITKDDIPELINVGVDGIAMSGSILRAGTGAGTETGTGAGTGTGDAVREVNNVLFTIDNCRDVSITPIKINNM